MARKIQQNASPHIFHSLKEPWVFPAIFHLNKTIANYVKICDPTLIGKKHVILILGDKYVIYLNSDALWKSWQKAYSFTLTWDV